MGPLQYNLISKTRATEVMVDFFGHGNGPFDFSITEAFRACAKILMNCRETKENINYEAAIDFLSCYVELRRLNANQISYNNCIHQIIYDIQSVPKYRVLKGSALVDNKSQTPKATIVNPQAQNPIISLGPIIIAAVQPVASKNLQRTCSQDRTEIAVHVSSWYQPTRDYKPVADQTIIQPAIVEREISQGWSRPEQKVKRVVEVREISTPNKASEPEELIQTLGEPSGLSKEVTQPQEVIQRKETIDPAKERRRLSGRKRLAKTTKTKSKPRSPEDIFLLPWARPTCRDGCTVWEPVTIRCGISDPKKPRYAGSTFNTAPQASALPIPSFFKMKNPPPTPNIDENNGEPLRTAQPVISQNEPEDEDSGYYST